MKTSKKCTCKWCTKYSPLYQKIKFLLQDNREEVKLLNNMMDDFMSVEFDSIFWKDKYYGTGPCDESEDIQRHIEQEEFRKKLWELIEIKELEIIERL
jgi:hypothetical protein